MFTIVAAMPCYWVIDGRQEVKNWDQECKSCEMDRRLNWTYCCWVEKPQAPPTRGDWICNLSIIMGWEIKGLRAHETFCGEFYFGGRYRFIPAKGGISIVVGRFNRWKQLSRRNIHLDEQMVVRFLWTSRNRSIQDHSDHVASKKPNNPLSVKDSSVPLMHSYARDLRSIRDFPKEKHPKHTRLKSVSCLICWFL